MVLFCFTGELGAGKTLSMTFLAWKNWFYRRKPIFANYHLFKIPYIWVDSTEKMDLMHEGVFCLPPDQKILCNPEIKEIGDVKVGDSVLTHMGRFREVEKVFKRHYDGDLIKITTKKFNLSSKLTPEHPILVGVLKLNKKKEYYKNTKWTEKQDRELIFKKMMGNEIKIKNRTKGACFNRLLRLKKYYEIEFEFLWKNANEIEKTDFLAYPIFRETKEEIKQSKRLCPYCKSEDIIFRGFTPKGSHRMRCKKCGKSFAEKFLNINELNNYFNKDLCYILGLYLADGTAHIKSGKVRFFVGKSLMNKIIRKIENVFSIKPKIYSQKSKCVEIAIHSRKLARIFKTFGKRKNKRAPIEILSLPLDYQKEFLKGYLDGDGHKISKYRTSYITISPSINFIIAQLLLRQKIVPSITNSKSISGKYQGTFSNNKSLKGIIYKNYLLLPIAKIEREKYSGDVFNLAVKEDNSYCLQNFSVHNCADEFWIWVDALESKQKKNRIATNILLKSRKRGLVYFYTSQTLEQLNRRVRKVQDFTAYPILNPNETLCKCIVFRTGYPTTGTYLKTFYFKADLIKTFYDHTEEVQPIKEVDENPSMNAIWQEDKNKEPIFFKTWEEADRFAESYWKEKWRILKGGI